MVHWRDNVGLVLGSIGGAVAIVLGFLREYEFVSALLGTVFGAGIAYFVTTRTQKRVWKREYAVRVAIDVYSDLFGAIKSVILGLGNKSFNYIDFQEWMLMQDDHRYLMVTKEFRERLDRFLEQLKKYSKEVVKVRRDIIPEIVIAKIERIFGIKTYSVPNTLVRYKKGRKTPESSVNIVDCLISGMNPVECATGNVTLTSEELTESIFWFEIDLIGNPNPLKFEKRPEMDEFLVSSREELKKNGTYNFIVEENAKLLEEARELKQEIANRIEEPWKI